MDRKKRKREGAQEPARGFTNRSKQKKSEKASSFFSFPLSRAQTASKTRQRSSERKGSVAVCAFFFLGSALVSVRSSRSRSRSRSMLARLTLVASRRSKETTEALARTLAASSSSAASSHSAVVAAASTSASVFSSSASPAPIGGPVPVLKEWGQAAVDARLKHEREMKGVELLKRCFFYRFSVFRVSIDG